MGIFVPSKSGDAMGEYAWRPFSKKQKREFAIAKKVEQERAENQDYYKTQRLASAYEKTVREQRKAVGLE